MPQPRWTLHPVDQPTSEALTRALACPPAIARILAARQITSETAQTFLHPQLSDLHDPNLLLGMPEAVARIQQAVAASEKILIYGDYDVDGTTATVLLKTAIERIASPGQPARVDYHVPHRLREGYGIQSARLADADADGVTLVISVDTGIRAFAQADEARALALDLIVTDHHLPDGQTGIPDAFAVINPAQPGCPYPNKNLCGAGVAFKVAHALLAAHASTEEGRRRLETVILPSFLKLVAVATIADSVPLTGENRAIVALGLRALANPIQPGLRALMEIAKLPLDQPPTAQQVGFRLAPRINAAGRMDVASDVVELFLTRDPVRAHSLAVKLDSLNQDRRATEAAALAAIDLQLLTLRTPEGDFPAECIVLDHPEWHRGVLGILASRVVERTHRPALILTSVIQTGAPCLAPDTTPGALCLTSETWDSAPQISLEASHQDEEAHGSGRSIPGFHLLDALTAAHAATPVFSRFGGHAHAVGFSLPNSRLPNLREALRTHTDTHLTLSVLTPELLIDAELTAAELTLELLRWIDCLAPFGHSHPEPVFLTRALTLAAPPRIIKDRHLCLPVAGPNGCTLDAMAWSRDGREPWTERIAPLQLTKASRIDAAFRLCENKHPQYGGLQLELLDLRPADDVFSNQ